MKTCLNAILFSSFIFFFTLNLNSHAQEERLQAKTEKIIPAKTEKKKPVIIQKRTLAKTETIKLKAKTFCRPEAKTNKKELYNKYEGALP